MNEILIYLQNKYNGNWMQIYESLQMKERIESEKVLELAKKFENRNIVTLLDSNYPEFLKQYYKPPFLVELENDKVYYIYGKDLEQKFEIPQGASESKQEKAYIEFINKVSNL